MAQFIATVKAVLDDSELIKLDNLCKKERTVDVKVALSGDANQLDNVNRSIENIRNNARTPIQLTMNSTDVVNQLQEIETRLTRIQAIHLNLGGNGRTRNANREITRQFNLASKYQKRMAKQLSSFELLDTERDLSSVDTLINQYQNAQREYSRILSQYGNGFTDAQRTQLREFEIDTEQALERMRSKFQDTINKNLQSGKFDKQFDSLLNNFDKLGEESVVFEGRIERIADALNRMRTASNFDEMFSAFNNFNSELVSAENHLSQLKTTHNQMQREQKAQDDALKAQQKARKLDADKGLLTSDIDLWSKNNVEAANNFKKRIDDIRTAISNCNNEADFSNIKQQFQQLQKDVANQDIVNSIIKSGSLGEFDLEFNDLENSLNQIRDVTKDLSDAFTDVTTAKTVLDNALKSGKTEDIVNSYNKMQDAIEKYQAKYNTAKQEQDNLNAKESLQRRKNRLDYEMDSWLKNNSAAVKKYGADIAELRSKIQSCNAVQLDDIENKFRDIGFAAQKAGLATQTFGDKLKTGIADEFTQLFSISRLFDYGVDAIRDMYNQVVEVDSAMVNLKKVTDETDSTYNKFLDDAADSAIALGRSMSSYVQQTADWTKLGYTLKEAQELSKLSSVYANVAEIDDTTAVSDMVTAMKAFNIETSNAVKITDALNELGNRFATDAGSLGSGLTKAAASMSNAGADLNQTLAMLTGGAEITQNANEFGNFLKTASMRIRGMKGELEELGEEVDPTVDSISKVQTQILNITKNTSKPINIFDDSGNFRNYYTIMEEIASIYNELASTEQAKLDEILFGKVRANQGAALIKAFQSGQIQKAYATAVGSEGSAMAEQEKWMESLEAKMASFEAAWQHLSTSVMQSDFLGGLIDFGTGAVELFADLVEGAGALNTALLGAGITGFLWNLD